MLSERNLVPKYQRKLFDAISSINLVYILNGKLSNDDVKIVFHNQAIDNSPGWNVLLKNMRFEFGYQKSRVRFSLPPYEDQFEEFISFVEDKLNIKEYEVTIRTGIKYIIEIPLENYIYDDEGIKKVIKLTNKVLNIA